MLIARAKSFSRAKVKALLCFKAKLRDVIEGVKRYQLRKEAAPYKTIFRAKKDIGTEGAYFRHVNTE